MSEYSIVASKLTKRFGRNEAVSDLSFNIRKGEIVGFLGPNGAGKSTTLRILTGLTSATSGEATVCGIPVARDPDAIKKKIGFMPENNPLPEDMRVNEYLHFRARLKRLSGKNRRQKVEEVMEICDLHRKARRKIIGTLSKGFRQRVGIADAILSDPEITILDEPTIGLDPHQILSIRKLLDDLRGKTTVILSSHILSEVEVCCDRVMILNSGRLVASGTADELREEFTPGSTYELEVKGSVELVERKLKELTEVRIKELKGPDADGFRTIEIKTDENGHELDSIFQKLKPIDEVFVRSLFRNESDLEDIFLAATRRSWEMTNQELNEQQETEVEVASS